MPEVISVEEFKNEGFAIIEDTEGKYIARRDSPEIEPLPNANKKTTPTSYEAYPIRKELCALLQSRDRMLT